MVDYPYASQPAPANGPPSVQPDYKWHERQWALVFVFMGGLALAWCSFLIGKVVAKSMEPEIGMPFFSFDPLGRSEFIEFTTGWIVIIGEVVGLAMAGIAVVGWIVSVTLRLVGQKRQLPNK